MRSGQAAILLWEVGAIAVVNVLALLSGWRGRPGPP